MGLTTEQLIERRTRVGASDVASILGVNPYGTAYDTWLDKRGMLKDWEGNEATGLGNDLEPVILKYAESQFGALVTGEVFFAEDLPLASSLDARLVDTKTPLDAKTAGLVGPLVGNWGPDDSDEIPEQYIVQLQAQMVCTGADIAHLAALIGGRGFAKFTVRRSRPLCDLIAERVRWFWDLVEAGTPPPESLPSAEVIRLIRRVPEKTVEIDASLVSAWLMRKEEEKYAKEETEAAQSAMLAALGDAEAGSCPTGLLTYYAQSRKGYEVKASTYRVARFKPRKEG